MSLPSIPYARYKNVLSIICINIYTRSLAKLALNTHVHKTKQMNNKGFKLSAGKKKQKTKT